MRPLVPAALLLWACLPLQAAQDWSASGAAPLVQQAKQTASRFSAVYTPISQKGEGPLALLLAAHSVDGLAEGTLYWEGTDGLYALDATAAGRGGAGRFDYDFRTSSPWRRGAIRGNASVLMVSCDGHIMNFKADPTFHQALETVAGVFQPHGVPDAKEPALIFKGKATGSFYVLFKRALATSASASWEAWLSEPGHPLTPLGMAQYSRDSPEAPGFVELFPDGPSTDSDGRPVLDKVDMTYLMFDPAGQKEGRFQRVSEGADGGVEELLPQDTKNLPLLKHLGLEPGSGEKLHTPCDLL